VPSLEFNSADLLRITRAASRRAAVYYFDAHPDSSTLTPDALVAIAFAAAAVEAFTNDLTDRVRIWSTAKWPGATTPALIAAVQAVIAVEAGREPQQLRGKYRAAVRALSGKSKSTDGRTVQELQRLVALRDAIMHAKAPRSTLPRKVSAALVDLRRRGLTASITSRSKAPLLIELQSPHLSEWAFVTARNVILAMLNLAPDVESVRSLNQHFRDAAM
jgi:hypothetical protein